MASPDQPPDAKQKLQRMFDSPWAMLVLVLHVGVLGIPLYWKARYSLAVRLLIILGSIVYTVAAVWAIVWMCGWLIRRLFG
jgi:tellurite resistance protein TehA-like permease